MSAWATAGSSRIRWKAELTGGDVKCEEASSHLGSDVRPRPTLWRVQPTQGGRRLQVQPSPIQPILSATCNDSRTKAGPKSILKKPLLRRTNLASETVELCLSCRWREFHVYQHLTAFKAETREKVHKVVTEANVSRLSNKLSTLTQPARLYSQTPVYTR